MAEVENVSAVATAAEIPSTPNTEIVGAELGTSPAQERSSNSHPHDSEYDTASDLEGGEHDYDDDDDDDEDDDGESITDDDDDDDEEDDDDDDDARPTEGGSEKPDDLQKKVDEDRSNPQYIPKRGTFYEHDDRTAEGAEAANPAQIHQVDVDEVSEAGGNNPQSPTAAISHASKTMKKWQPASGNDRWSHDRFDNNEQAPKSRSELVSAYGYDIRNEDAPPRARRRRRYGRGPSKYSRNWEDETAYLKASNNLRKPPRPSDFPALNERIKPRVKSSHSVREEKENQQQERRVATDATETQPQQLPPRRSHSGERREHESVRRGNNKHKNYGRGGQQQHQAVGRQAAMEFKNKQRANPAGTGQHNNSQGNNRHDQQHDRSQQHRFKNSHQSTHVNNEQQMRQSGKQQSHQSKQHNDAHNGPQDRAIYAQMEQGSSHQPSNQSQHSRQQPKAMLPTTNLSARLQQVQNRNDPSHVGSVQMHALANQHQLVGQQQQQQLLAQQQQLNTQDQGRPKRYSSIRRTQHDTQNMDQQQLQQLHMQQQQQQVAAQPIMLQDQQLLQANLMQIYHQENLQAQMQALQVSAAGGPQAAPPKPVTVQQPPSQQQQYANAPAAAAPNAYYVTAPEAAPYNQQPTTYLQNTVPPSGAAIAYASPPPPSSQQSVNNVAQTVAAAGALPYVAANVLPNSAPQVAPNVATNAGSVAAGTAAQSSYPNYNNYQNYNTVGGTTYFVPPAQAAARPVALPQRRPTNAIPILPPAEKSKQRNQPAGEAKEDGKQPPANAVGSADNIDHILDNMFVQRPVYQPAPAQARKSASPPTDAGPVTSGSGGSDSNAAATPTQSSSNASQAEEQPTENISNVESAAVATAADAAPAKETN